MKAHILNGILLFPDDWVQMGPSGVLGTIKLKFSDC